MAKLLDDANYNDYVTANCNNQIRSARLILNRLTEATQVGTVADAVCVHAKKLSETVSLNNKHCGRGG